MTNIYNNCLQKHVLRSCHHATNWSNALTKQWITGKQFVPLWSDLTDVSEACRELIKCACKKTCREKCKCRKNNYCVQCCVLVLDIMQLVVMFLSEAKFCFYSFQCICCHIMKWFFIVLMH